MIAIRNGQLDLAELLLGHTRTDCRSAHFCATPYSLALTLGHLRLAALILEKNPEVTHHLPSRLARIVHAWKSLSLEKSCCVAIINYQAIHSAYFVTSRILFDARTI